jgi:hypothetical protein
MGMDQAVQFEEGTAIPAWAAVRDLLGTYGFPVQARMFDGQLAFPDELPPPDWNDLRLATPLGMVTVRREPGRVVLVTWGNADAALRQAWNAVTWAYARAGGGTVLSASGSHSAEEFRATAELPAVLGT